MKMNLTNLIRFYELVNRKSKFEANKNKQDGLDYEVYYDFRYNILINSIYFFGQIKPNKIELIDQVFMDI